MQRIAFLAAVAIILALPLAAKAGPVVEASLGMQTQAEISGDHTMVKNGMIAAGYGLGEMIRAELGFVVDMPQDESPTNLRIRPMLVIDPPILPLYGRLVVGVANVIGDGDMTYEYGGAIGAGASLGGLGLFAELGYIPQNVNGTLVGFVEGRAGAMMSF